MKTLKEIVIGLVTGLALAGVIILSANLDVHHYQEVSNRTDFEWVDVYDVKLFGDLIYSVDIKAE